MLEVVKEAERGVKSLDDLKDQLPQVPTGDLVSGFLEVNDFKNNVKKFRDLVRDELIGDKKKDYEDGRFKNEDSVEYDEKGNMYLTGVDGKKLKAEKRTKVKFDKKKAREVLEEKDMLQRGSELEVKVKNENFVGKLQDMQDNLLTVYKTIQDGMQKEILKEQLEVLAEVLADDIEAKIVPSEDKVEALVTIGELSTDDAHEMYDIQTTYAVKKG
jgi:hypothetical protein